ncbi:hypothetical protein CRG98_045026 [Punica granatum]|uniref:Uncharacterized protein n=1 Tax=Punica granatum TaxID=22663 RepID=A0A2I0HSK8_PUNGR|nr:hypothetical protein CRG98_045026 [Punica granatum]
MDTKSWTRSSKRGNVEVTTSVREWRGASKRGAWHWFVALLGWCSGRRGLHCRRGGCALLKLVSPLERLLAGNALVSPMGFLLARRLLVAGWAAVHLLGTGV